MKRLAILCILLLNSGFAAAGSDVLYDPGLAGIWGASIRPGTNLEAMVQPFRTRVSGWADRIGIGMGVGADPNYVGFRVTLTDTDLVTKIPGQPIAGSWSMHPASASMAYTYIDIEPVFLDTNEVYALLIEPGDDQMFGGVAYTFLGGAGWGTSDDWATTVRLPYPAAIRVYGTAVPEPGSAFALAAAIIGLSVQTFNSVRIFARS